MRAGRLRDRVQVLERTGHTPTWVEVADLWAGIEPPKTPGEQSGLRAGSASTIRFRAGPALRQGQLVRQGSRWWHIDGTLADQYRREVTVTATELLGLPGLYTPENDEPYPVMAALLRANAHVGILDENRTRIELLAAQLQWPWAQRGDTVSVQGVVYRIDARADASDDGTLLTVTVT